MMVVLRLACFLSCVRWLGFFLQASRCRYVHRFKINEFFPHGSSSMTADYYLKSITFYLIVWSVSQWIGQICLNDKFQVCSFGNTFLHHQLHTKCDPGMLLKMSLFHCSCLDHPLWSVNWSDILGFSKCIQRSGTWVYLRMCKAICHFTACQYIFWLLLCRLNKADNWNRLSQQPWFRMLYCLLHH